MPTSILLNLGSGDLHNGFPRVTATLWSTEHPLPEQWLGALPPADYLVILYREWQVIYRSLCDRRAFRTLVLDDELEIDAEGITNVSQKSFQEQCQQLQEAMNDWLNSEAFCLLSQSMRSRLDPTMEIRVVIETNDPILRRLPWQQWNFFQHYPNAEMALSQPEYQRRETTYSKRLTQKVRILAILGNCSGIDVEAETQFLRQLQDADVTFLVSPSERAFRAQLERSLGWDILFFAGHSQTEGETGHLYLNDNLTDNSLTLDQLKGALQAAIDNGLKLAIFNSCDGLGLALALERIHIPVVMVMREAVPNQVAQQFFHQFLTAFAIERLPFYTAVRQARQQLRSLEDEFPGASWLPVICQNPAAESPTWLQLGGMPSCPYRGLFAFQEEDADLFFGREVVTRQLVSAVQNQSLVAIVGASGSGKSSLVLAGLIPQLRQSAQAKHLIAVFRPGNNPLRNLAEALLPLLEQNSIYYSVFQLERDLRSDINLLPQLINQMISSDFSNSTNARKLVVVADQFEELYTQTAEVDCQLFLNQLLQAGQFCPALTVVLTLRADFYGYALSYRPFSDALQGAVYNLSPMDREELKSAIVCPATKMQVKLEPRLTEKLIEAAWEHPGRLPLLEFALTQLWSKQSNGWLTHEAYTEIGGVEGALANHAEEVYTQLSGRDRDRARHIFLQLVQPGAGTEASRRLATRDEVGDANWDLVSHLASARLVITNHSEATGEETLEVVHEALIRGWEQLNLWMQLDRDFRHWQEHLRIAMRTWVSSSNDEGALLRGKPLADAEYWQDKRFLELSSLERNFIGLSVGLREREGNQRKLRQRLTISGLSTGLVVALSLAGVAGWQWRKARISEINSLRSSAETLLTSNQNFDALITSIRAANRIHQTFGVDNNTRSQLVGTLLQAINFTKEHNRLEDKIEEGKDNLNDVVFSPDGNIIATASWDKAVKLWSRDGKLLGTLQGHNNGVICVTFSPDGKTIASGSWDKTVKLWSRDGKLLGTLYGHQEGIHSITFSPDGKTIASGSGDKTVKLWSRDGKELKTLRGHQYGVFGISFSPDGKTIATASGDKTVKLWSKEGKQLQTLKGHKGGVNSVIFSPDGNTIATAGWDKTIKLWSKEGKQKKTFLAHDGTINKLSFSPDGKIIASASNDKTAQLWSLNGQKLDVLRGHDATVLNVVFSPDGKQIATASEDKTVRLWDQDTEQLYTLRGHQNQVFSVVFSPDGKTIASASWDKTVKLWDRDGKEVYTLRGHTDKVNNVSFSPDGKTIATASADKTVKLWSRNGKLLKTLSGHKDIVWNVSFSPDGKTIATASADKTVKLWSRDGQLLKTLSGHKEVINSVKFSPNGRMIATGSWDKTVRLWSLDGRALKILYGHINGVNSVAFSPDSRIIASASWDNTVRLWNLDGKELKTLRDHRDVVNSIVFSPDGNIIATASNDRTVKLWDRNGTLLRTLRGYNNNVWSVNFSLDGKTLVTGSGDFTVILWNSYLDDLKPLLVRACTQVRDYLQNNPNVSREDRGLCDGI